MLTADINDLTTLHESRDMAIKLKDQKIDIDNWQQKPHNSIVYILGSKIEKFENELKFYISEFNNTIQKFSSNHDKIAQLIEDKTEDIDELKNLVSSLDTLIMDTKVHLHAAEKVDNTVQLELPQEEMESKKASDKKMLEDYILRQNVILFEKEYDNISSKCNDISLEIEKIESEYKDFYSTRLKETVNSEHPIVIPNCYQLEYLLKSIEANNNEFEQKLEEAKKLIEKTQSSYNQVYVFIVNREKESHKIYDSSSLANSTCKKFKKLDLCSSIPVLAEAKEQILLAENMKNWDENAEGDTIDTYNRLMKEANEIIQDGAKIIEEKFNNYLEEVKDSLDKVKFNYMDETDNYEKDKSNYEKGLDILKETSDKFEALKIIEEKMELNKKDELDEIGNELTQNLEKIENLSKDFPERMKSIVELNNENFASYSKNDLIDELKQDNSNLDEFSDEKIDEKGSKYISKYAKILTDKKMMEKYIKEYEFDIEINDTKEIIDVLHDLIIIYRSTLLLSPNSLAEEIINRSENCSDSKFSQMMALLYAHKFTVESDKFAIENLSDAKEKIESKINSDDSFSVEISKQICRRITKSQTIEKQIELNILIDFITYLPDFEEAFRNYLVTSIGNNMEIRSMKNNLEEMEYAPEKLTTIIKESLEKVNALTKAKLCATKKDNDNDNLPIIADYGSYTTKLGYAGEIELRASFYSLVGKEKKFTVSLNPLGRRDIYIGNEVYDDYSKFIVSNPIENGMITNFDDFNALVSYGFSNKLMVSPKNRPVMLTEKILTSKYNREKIIQTMFETFATSSFCMVNSNVLSLYSVGRYTGYSVDIGYKCITFAPVIEGFSYPQYTVHRYGGNSINELLSREYEREYNHYYITKEFVEKTKVNKCFVSLDYDNESNTVNQSDYCYLPDGSLLYYGPELYISPECFFKPEINYLDYFGIPEQLVNNIKKSYDDYKKLFYSNIFVSGLTTKLPGFLERIEKDVRKLVPDETIDIIKPEFDDSTFVGASIFASLGQFSQMAVSRDEYNDAGPGIVHRKCVY